MEKLNNYLNGQRNFYDTDVREIYTIPKPKLIFSPYKKSNGNWPGAIYKFYAALADINRTSMADRNSEDIFAIKILKKDIESGSRFGNMNKDVLAGMRDLQMFLKSVRNAEINSGSTFYSDMMFCMTNILLRFDVCHIPDYGGLHPCSVGAYLMGLGPDDDELVMSLMKILLEYEDLRKFFEKYYPNPIETLINCLKNGAYRTNAEKEQGLSDLMEFMVFLFKLEIFISDWMSARGSEFDRQRANSELMAMRSWIIWSYKFMMKNKIYPSEEVQKMFYKRYSNI